MELKLRNYFLLTSYHLPAFCSSADTSCGEGSWSLSRFKLSRLIFNSSRLIRFDKSCCSSSMDFLAGLMRDSATECLRSTISLFSLSNEEYKLRALEAKHHDILNFTIIFMLIVENMQSPTNLTICSTCTLGPASPRPTLWRPCPCCCCWTLC